MSTQNSRERNAATFALVMLLAIGLAPGVHGQGGQLTGAIYTTNSSATAVNWNIYATATDVYISGGPQNKKSAGLPDGTYYFQVTEEAHDGLTRPWRIGYLRSRAIVRER